VLYIHHKGSLLYGPQDQKSFATLAVEHNMDQMYYWLVPDEPDREKLQRMIQNFSNVYLGPSFVPHITLGTGRRIPPPPPREYTAPTITFQEVQTEDSPYRALYYRCTAHPMLEKLRIHFGTTDKYVPHLSLLYGAHSRARRRDWCSHTPLYSEPIVCSSIWVVRGGPKVSQWNTIHKFNLEA
jgi:hypothetical protein